MFISYLIKVYHCLHCMVGSSDQVDCLRATGFQWFPLCFISPHSTVRVCCYLGCLTLFHLCYDLTLCLHEKEKSVMYLCFVLLSIDCDYCPDSLMGYSYLFTSTCFGSVLHYWKQSVPIGRHWIDFELYQEYHTHV